MVGSPRHCAAPGRGTPGAEPRGARRLCRSIRFRRHRHGASRRAVLHNRLWTSRGGHSPVRGCVGTTARRGWQGALRLDARAGRGRGAEQRVSTVDQVISRTLAIDRETVRTSRYGRSGPWNRERKRTAVHGFAGPYLSQKRPGQPPQKLARGAVGARVGRGRRGCHARVSVCVDSIPAGDSAEGTRQSSTAQPQYAFFGR